MHVPLSLEKTVGPSTSYVRVPRHFLDSVKLQASLPDEKLTRIFETYFSSPVVSKCEHLSLLGHLNFAMRIIPQGRSFISRLLTLAHSVENLSDKICLDQGCKSDLQFWSQLLSNWNDISFLFTMPLNPLTPSISTLTRPLLQVLGVISEGIGSPIHGQSSSLYCLVRIVSHRHC